MQIKKSREVELESKKPTLFLLGLAVACALVLSAFEWRSPIDQSSLGDQNINEIPIFEAEIIPPSFQEKEKPVEKKSEHKKEVSKSIIDHFKFDEMELPAEETDFPEVDDPPLVQDISVPLESSYDEKPLMIADVMPEFPGGDSARVAFLTNTVFYPPMAKDAGISGRVYVGFTVAKNGSIEDIELKRGVGGGLDEEALKAVRNMPDWSPGFNNGHPVSVRFVMPVTFTLK